jgi:hypothetical protein
MSRCHSFIHFFILLFTVASNNKVITKKSKVINKQVTAKKSKVINKQSTIKKSTMGTKKILKNPSEESEEEETTEEKAARAKDFIPEIDAIVVPETIPDNELDSVSLGKKIFIIVSFIVLLVNGLCYGWSLWKTNRIYAASLKIFLAQKPTNTQMEFDKAIINNPFTEKHVSSDKKIQKNNQQLKNFFDPHSFWESKPLRYTIIAPAYLCLKYIHGKQLWSTIDNA